ncbi:hypothetical protein NQ318_011234 [Aromia moschata]|uniref:Nuclear pore complex protein Nup98-Nup96 n=1 Tax=Aromia moschata TaxID=1265417 RepID=A0AAV8YJD4_9CUCU|nr:hypothetical protein NQ318_011234 [Aromia moschata]
MFGNLNKPAFGAAAPNASFGFGSTSTGTANPFGQSQLFGKPATGGFWKSVNFHFWTTHQHNRQIYFKMQTQVLEHQPLHHLDSERLTYSDNSSLPLAACLIHPPPLDNKISPPVSVSDRSPRNRPFSANSPNSSKRLVSFSLLRAISLAVPRLSGGQQAAGTVIKFNPVTGTDTMMKNGVAQSINTKHHSITCMKEYENKSFEELRFEDYLANRKGRARPSTTTWIWCDPVRSYSFVSSRSLRTARCLKPAFGQATGFGQTTSTFGQNTPGFGLGNQQQQSGTLFGKPTGFGAPTSSTPSFGFGSTAQTANPFGGAQAAKPFGSTTQPIFGTTTNTTQQSGFGTGLFGQTNTQNAGSLFGKPAQPTTGFGATPSTTGFTFGPPASTQTSSLFQPNKPLFGQTSTTTGFGPTNTFGNTSSTPFGNTFNKPAAPTFGNTQQTGFGTALGGLQNQGSSLFGNTAKPGGLFGNTGTTGLFGNTNTTFQPNTGFGIQQQQPQQSLFPPPEQQNSSNLALLTSDPFGDAPHLAGLEPKLKPNSPSVSATDPKELKALLDPQKKVDMTHNAKLKVFPFKSVKDSLFEGVFAKNKPEGHSEEYVKTNCRRLVLKQRPNANSEGNSPGIMRTDILKHITSPEEQKNNSREENRIESNIKNDLRTTPLRLTFENTMNGEISHSINMQTYNVLNSSIAKNDISDKKDSPPPTDDEDEPINLAGGDTTAKSYPCGIICTRPEYYTLPSLEELTQYIDENGSCIVKGFTIGRKGYGNVYFPDEMNVSGLNIDELVHFRYREINVYPDDSKKPPVGQGLNRRAQVTLDNVYPKRSDTNTLIKDVSELLQMNFAEKLRRVTVKKGAKFVDYRPETGSWVFKVDHFSRYGFNDSDDESEQNDKEGTKKQPEPIKKPAEVENQGKKINGLLEKTETLKKKDGSKEMEARMGLDEDIFVEEGDRFTPEEDQVIPQSMYVDDDDFHTVPTGIPMSFSYEPFKTSKSIQVMKSTLFADDDKSSEGSGSHASLIRQYWDVPEEIPDIPQLQLVKEDMIPKKKVVLRPKVEKVFNYGGNLHSFAGVEVPTEIIQNRCYMDLGVFKGKSFKVGWMKGFNFLSVNAKQGEISGQLAINTIDLGGYTKDFDPLKEVLQDSLEIVLEESTYDLDVDCIPTFRIRKDHAYLQKQTKLFSKLVSKYSDKDSQYLYSIWTLADALWGPDEDTFTNRRLQANTSYDDYATKDIVKNIFNQLTVFKITEAANLAIDNRFPNLALLISQLSLTNRTKLFLQEQIEMWHTSMVLNHMSGDIKKIYLLLSGTPIKEDINIFESIDWKRALGMHLWYVCDAGVPIEIAIELYEKAFEEQSYAEAPYPPYRNSYIEDASFDVLYHMLLLYRSRIHRLSSALNPATHTDNLLDYRLSWLLLQLFLSLDVGLIESSEKTKLCTSFSNQLESLGKWEWAIFVLLYLDDNDLKKNLVTGILDRNLSPENDKQTLDIQDDLVNKMHVPATWIHSVKGEKLLLLERYFPAFNHLSHACEYYKANNLLMDHLIPTLFINEQYDLIRTLIDAIKEGSKSISHWSNQAGLFSDFLELQENVISLRAEDLLKLQMQLQSISERIGALPIKTEQQKLCVAEMSKRCASVYKELCKKSGSAQFRNSYSDFIETLVMPPDFKQNEALYIINQFDSIGQL